MGNGKENVSHRVGPENKCIPKVETVKEIGSQKWGPEGSLKGLLRSQLLGLKFFSGPYFWDTFSFPVPIFESNFLFRSPILIRVWTIFILSQGPQSQAKLISDMRSLTQLLQQRFPLRHNKVGEGMHIKKISRKPIPMINIQCRSCADGEEVWLTGGKSGYHSEAGRDGIL